VTNELEATTSWYLTLGFSAGTQYNLDYLRICTAQVLALARFDGADPEQHSRLEHWLFCGLAMKGTWNRGVIRLSSWRMGSSGLCIFSGHTEYPFSILKSLNKAYFN
jgi:hypothetical protein